MSATDLRTNTQIGIRLLVLVYLCLAFTQLMSMGNQSILSNDSALLQKKESSDVSTGRRLRDFSKDAAAPEPENDSAPDPSSVASSLPTISSKGNLQHIFYHAYIAPEDSTQEQAKKIIQEQLEQVGKSTKSFDGTHLYYNTVGQPLDSKFMEQLCQDNHIECHHLNHYEKGFEKLTHQQIQAFCASNENQSVTYMHSKGSFHSNPSNDHLRRSMTTAVTSPQCHQAFAKDTCNACGLLFAPEKFPFFPGNFWVAQCQYVNQLLEPAKFEDEATKLAKEALFMRSTGQIDMSIYKDMPSTMGVGRYAAEMWVASHPSLRPCDLNAKWFKYWQRHDAKEENFQVGLAPRGTMNNKRIPKSLRARKREYFLLPGYLLRWSHFYNSVPPRDSWYWKFFPDGKFWKETSETYGAETFQEVTKRFIKN